MDYRDVASGGIWPHYRLLSSGAASKSVFALAIVGVVKALPRMRLKQMPRRLSLSPGRLSHAVLCFQSVSLK